MIRIIYISTFLLMGIVSNAQSNKVTVTTADSIRIVINNLFQGMLNADSIMIENSFSQTALLQTIATDKEGLIQIKNEKVQAFAGSVGRLKKGDADERIEFSSILIDGPLASVWTPYQFYYKGSYSHAGVDSFQLVRINGSWKIQYLIDTRRK